MSGKAKGRRGSDQETATQDVGEALRAVMDEAGVSEGSVTCYRKSETTGKEEYLDRVGADLLADDVLGYLKRRWGGGSFRLVLRDGGGVYVKGGNLHFDIAGAPKVEGPEDDRLQELERRLQEAAESKGGPDPLMMMMFQTMRDELRELRRRPQETGKGPAELAVELMTAMQASNAPILEALLSRDRDGPDPMEQVSQILGMAVQLKELSGEGSGMDKVIGQLANPLGQFFQAQADGARHSIAQAAAGDNGDPNTRALPTMTRPTDAPAWYPLLERSIPQLLKWAQDGMDPELRADLVLEELPDRYLGPIHETLQRPEFTAEFLAAVPQAQDVREWFGKFFSRILEGLEAMWEPELEEGADPGGPAPSRTSTAEPEPEATPEATPETTPGGAPAGQPADVDQEAPA